MMCDWSFSIIRTCRRKFFGNLLTHWNDLNSFWPLQTLRKWRWYHFARTSWKLMSRSNQVFCLCQCCNLVEHTVVRDTLLSLQSLVLEDCSIEAGIWSFHNTFGHLPFPFWQHCNNFKIFCVADRASSGPFWGPSTLMDDGFRCERINHCIYGCSPIPKRVRHYFVTKPRA